MPCGRYVYVNESGSSSTRKGSASSEIIKFNWLLRMTINPGVEIHISLLALQQISAGAQSTYTHKPKHPSRCSHPPTDCDSDLQPPTYENTRGAHTRAADNRCRSKVQKEKFSLKLTVCIEFSIFQFGRILRKNGFVN